MRVYKRFKKSISQIFVERLERVGVGARSEPPGCVHLTFRRAPSRIILGEPTPTLAANVLEIVREFGFMPNFVFTVKSFSLEYYTCIKLPFLCNVVVFVVGETRTGNYCCRSSSRNYGSSSMDILGAVLGTTVRTKARPLDDDDEATSCDVSTQAVL